MAAKGSLTLSTARLTLREFEETDWPAVHEYGSDPHVVRYMGWGPNSEQDTRDFVRKALDSRKENPRQVYHLAIIRRVDSRMIGACGIFNINSLHREAEIGYVLNRRYWNLGYMTEAAGRVVLFALDDLDLHRVYATCDPANVASYRVMENIGMAREGLLRENRYFKGKYRDSLLYSVLSTERGSLPPSAGRRAEENSMVPPVEFAEGTASDLDLIQGLWEKLYAHHRAVSHYFDGRPSHADFNLRKKELLEKSKAGGLRVDVARDKTSGLEVAYCVSSLNAAGLGEIDSIYVEKDYRGGGIGGELMQRALTWLDARAAGAVVVGVGEGNERVFAFYRRYQFYPRSTILQRRNNGV